MRARDFDFNLLLEVNKQNQTIINIIGLQINFDVRFNEIKAGIQLYQTIPNRLPNNNFIKLLKSQIDDFDKVVNEFVKSSQLDFESDFDLRRKAKRAIKQLEKLNKLLNDAD